MIAYRFLLSFCLCIVPTTVLLTGCDQNSTSSEKQASSPEPGLASPSPQMTPFSSASATVHPIKTASPSPSVHHHVVKLPHVNKAVLPSPPPLPTASPQPSARLVVTDLGKGVGPVKSLELGPLNPTLAQDGKKLYVTHCATCHQFKSKLIGPALAKVTQRRKPEWIMNMILNPVEMTQKDPQAKELADKMMLQMADLKIQQQQARAILEFFRAHDAKE